MATSERRISTNGFMPAVNDIVAFGAMFGAYVVRFGTVAEGISGEMWLIPLILTTDLVLPILGAIWLLGVPVYQMYRRLQA